MPVHIVVAFSSKDFGIGKDHGLPWDIPEDRAHFATLTKNNVVVMGRKTYESIPEAHRPLKGRKNIVITSQPQLYSATIANAPTTTLTVETDLIYMNEQELDIYIKNNEKTQTIFIAGGQGLYEKYMGYAQRLYVTLVDKAVSQCDCYFPTHAWEHYQVCEYSTLKFSKNENCTFRYMVYEKTKKRHQEYMYLDLVQDVLVNGNDRPDRTGVGTIGVFGRHMRFDISRTVPFLTTKTLAWKSVIKELLFFMRGQTDSKELEKQGVSIWKGNTTREFLDQRGLHHYREGDMGPMYGYLWRHIGEDYQGCDADYKGKGYDQLKELLHGLRKDPFSRRHLLTTFYPPIVSQSVLMPCHGIAVQFYVEEKNHQKYLSCLCMQRSADTFLGLPFNIASYAVMTHLIAKMCDMIPNEMIVDTGDTHIYKNHIQQVHTQVARKPLPFPVLEVHDSVREKEIEDITLDDFDVIGYIHHSMIRAPMAV